MLFLILFTLYSANAEDTQNKTLLIPPAAYLEDGKLIFDFFSPWALGLCISFGFGLIFTTIVACWTDLGNRSTYGDLAAQRDFHKKNSTTNLSSTKPKPVAEKEEEPLLKEEKKSKSETTSNSESSESESSSLGVESTQSFLDIEDTQIHESSSHLDAFEKHARIIQAIYQVSGRDKNTKG